jgi:hypothetical protein
MGDVQIFDLKGKKIVYIDFSNCSPEDALSVMTKAKEIIGKQPLGSILTLTNLTDMHFNPSSNQQFKEYTDHNQPYVKAAAIYGMKGLLKSLYQFFSKRSKRELELFETREEALEWLTNIK